MEIKIVFGQVLREVRTQKGISQEKLALDAEIDRSYISKLENGVYQPSISMLFNIAKVLQVRPSELIKLAEDRIE